MTIQKRCVKCFLVSLKSLDESAGYQYRRSREYKVPLLGEDVD